MDILAFLLDKLGGFVYNHPGGREKHPARRQSKRGVPPLMSRARAVRHWPYHKSIAEAVLLFLAKKRF